MSYTYTIIFILCNNGSTYEYVHSFRRFTATSIAAMEVFVSTFWLLVSRINNDTWNFGFYGCEPLLF